MCSGSLLARDFKEIGVGVRAVFGCADREGGGRVWASAMQCSVQIESRQ